MWPIGLRAVIRYLLSKPLQKYSEQDLDACLKFILHLTVRLQFGGFRNGGAYSTV